MSGCCAAMPQPHTLSDDGSGPTFNFLLDHPAPRQRVGELPKRGHRALLPPGLDLADTAYGNAENLGWLVEERQITPFIPVIDKSDRTDGTWSRSDFEWDPENEPVHLSGRACTSPVPAQLLRPGPGQGYRGAAQVPGAEIRLRCLRVEASLLPQGGCPLRHAHTEETSARSREPAGRRRPTRSPATSARRSRCCLPS